MGRRMRKPDGTETDDPDEYAAAWVRLGEQLSRCFPGYVMNSCNPNIEMVTHSPRQYADRFTLSLPACAALLGVREDELGREPEPVRASGCDPDIGCQWPWCEVCMGRSP